MSYSSDLLIQARHLADKEPRRPRQASLRRAVSAAYYSLINLLVADTGTLMMRGTTDSRIRPVIQRAFVHGIMKRAAKSFAGGTLPTIMDSAMNRAAVSADLRLVALAVVDLQETRHEADYDLSKRFSRSEVHDLIKIAETATSTWHT